MKRALSEFHVAPIRTTVPLHLQIMDNPTFLSGDLPVRRRRRRVHRAGDAGEMSAANFAHAGGWAPGSRPGRTRSK
jgi:acetyl/propionyl-CoA carboxylase alpha subunit